MSPIKRFLASIKKVNKDSVEDEFYKQLFINNPTWNKAEPNKDEILRWNFINELIKTNIQGNLASSGYGKLQILDLGCGRGWLTNLLSEFGKVTGIEPVKDVVLYAKKLFPNLNIIEGTTKTLLKSKHIDKFDLIVSSEVIEHVSDTDKPLFVSEIKSLLNNKGYLIITTPRKDAEEEWKKYSDPNQPVEEWMSESDVYKLVTSSGFEKIDIRRVALAPAENAPLIDIYQIWLFQLL